MDDPVINHHIRTHSGWIYNLHPNLAELHLFTRFLQISVVFDSICLKIFSTGSLDYGLNSRDVHIFIYFLNNINLFTAEKISILYAICSKYNASVLIL